MLLELMTGIVINDRNRDIFTVVDWIYANVVTCTIVPSFFLREIFYSYHRLAEFFWHAPPQHPIILVSFSVFPSIKARTSSSQWRIICILMKLGDAFVRSTEEKFVIPVVMILT